MDPEDRWREVVRATLDGCPRALVAAAVEHVAAAIAGGAHERHAADLALAYAVSRGDARAIRRFDQHVDGELRATARAIDRDASFVDEVCQRTRVRLVVGDGDGGPRVAGYRGAGPLRAWAAIVAHRVALNLKRAGRTALGAATDDVLADLVDREPDPELRHLKTMYRAEFKDALVAALTTLDDRRRAVLRLRFAEGLELAQIGRLYQVHESTASRWITGALRTVADATRERMIARLAVTARTADSVARMVQSQLDLSIARLLG